MFGSDPPDDDEAPDSEATQRADHEYDQQRDDALTDRFTADAAKLFASDSIAQAVVQAAAEDRLPPPPPSVPCPQCGFKGAIESRFVPGMSCPACGAVFRFVNLPPLCRGRGLGTEPGPCERDSREPVCRWCTRAMLDPRIAAAARRIKRATLASLDRDAGIDTSKPPRPLVDSLPGLQAQLASRHDLPMRVVADILDEVVPMLDLLARVRAVIDASVARETAMAAIDGWAEVRDLLYPDTEVARQLNVRRRMTPAEHEAERAAADAAEAEAWAGVRTTEDPLDAPPVGFSECAGCLQMYPAADSLKLRTKGKLFAFEPGVFCPDCAAKYDRGELVRPT